MQSAAFLKWSWITDRQLTLLRRDADIEVHSGPMLIIYEKDGGEGWIRTSVRLRGQIYSLLPLTTRPPLQVSAGAPCGGVSVMCQRVGRVVATRKRSCAPISHLPPAGHAFATP